MSPVLCIEFSTKSEASGMQIIMHVWIQRVASELSFHLLFSAVFGKSASLNLDMVLFVCVCVCTQAHTHMHISVCVDLNGNILFLGSYV